MTAMVKNPFLRTETDFEMGFQYYLLFLAGVYDVPLQKFEEERVETRTEEMPLIWWVGHGRVTAYAVRLTSFNGKSEERIFRVSEVERFKKRFAFKQLNGDIV